MDIILLMFSTLIKSPITPGPYRVHLLSTEFFIGRQVGPPWALSGDFLALTLFETDLTHPGMVGSSLGTMTWTFAFESR